MDSIASDRWHSGRCKEPVLQEGQQNQALATEQLRCETEQSPKWSLLGSDSLQLPEMAVVQEAAPLP